MIVLRGAVGAALSALCLLAAAGPAQAADVTLDDVHMTYDKPDDKIVVKRFAVKGGNLTKAEWKALLADETPEAENQALWAKVKADSVTMTDIGFVSPSNDIKGQFAVATLSGIAGRRLARVDLTALQALRAGSFLNVAAAHVGPLDLGKAADADGWVRTIAALGVTAIAIEGFDNGQGDPSAPEATIAHLRIGQMLFSAAYDGLLPIMAEATVKDVTMSIPPGDGKRDSFVAAGLDKSKADAHFASSCDARARTCKLSDLSLGLAGLGSLAFSGDLANMPERLDDSSADAALASFADVAIADAEAKFANVTLFDKVLQFYADSKGVNSAVLRAEFPGKLDAFPEAVGDDPKGGRKIAEALKAFLKDPRNLTVSLRAKGLPVPVAEILATSNAQGLGAKMRIEAIANH